MNDTNLMDMNLLISLVITYFIQMCKLISLGIQQTLKDQTERSNRF